MYILVSACYHKIVYNFKQKEQLLYFLILTIVLLLEIKKVINMSNNPKTILEYLEKLQANGRHYFTFDELTLEMGVKRKSISVILSRLAKRERVKVLCRGFGVILDRNGYEPHISNYINAMMKHREVNYYVGVLSAAAYWGASHQAAMSYQIVVDKNIKPIYFKGIKIEFIFKSHICLEYGIDKVQGVGGIFNISNPELTAFDIVHFTKRAGELNNVATILEELHEKLNLSKMSALIKKRRIPTQTLQRMGYIFDNVLKLEKLAACIEKAVKKRKAKAILLSSDGDSKPKFSDYTRSEKWNIYINVEVESD